MPENKTKATSESVDRFLSGLPDETRRKDCEALVRLLTKLTKEPPTLWGTSIVGFGIRRYSLANGKEGEICRVGFASRKKDISLYGLQGTPEAEKLLAKLGRHEAGKGCVNIRSLADVDAKVLAKLVEAAFRDAGPKRKTDARNPLSGADEEKRILAYHRGLSPADRATCELLRSEITRALPKAATKVWHGSPVWFLEGNPVAGYHAAKGGVSLLFWSGQSFERKGLTPLGKFKAAEIRYASVEDVKTKELRGWLALARTIQWDYKNVAKNKGVLVRLK